MAIRDIDPAVIGREYDRLTYPPVAAADLIAYARSLGVEDPIYLDEGAAAAGPYKGLVAFPTYVVKLRGGVHFPPEVVKEMTRSGFDAGKDIELGEPIRPGDVLTARSCITEIYDKTGRSGTMTFLVFRHELRNQRDELVANVDNRIMQRS
jgi:acyl dehydratase